MRFVHEDPGFDALVRIVAGKHGLSPALVEKDYWVTHALWALHEQGLDVWFKGGTSLSKGFGLIERFSEDLDLKLDRGAADGMPAVNDWSRTGAGATGMRRSYFEWLAGNLRVAGAEIQRVRLFCDDLRSWIMRVKVTGCRVPDPTLEQNHGGQGSGIFAACPADGEAGASARRRCPGRPV